MIGCVIFDLGGVIVPLDFDRAYKELERFCPLPAEQMPARILDTALVRPFERGEITPEDFYRALSAELQLTATYEEFCGVWNALFVTEGLIGEEVFQSLRRRFRLMLLSNTNGIHFEFIRGRYRQLDHFDEFILSHEVRLLKPEAGIYHLAIERSGRPAPECLFIDDRPENVEGARAAGIDAIQFRSYDELVGQFARRGIELPPAAAR